MISPALIAANRLNHTLCQHVVMKWQAIGRCMANMDGAVAFAEHGQGGAGVATAFGIGSDVAEVGTVALDAIDQPDEFTLGAIARTEQQAIGWHLPPAILEGTQDWQVGHRTMPPA